MLKTLSIKQAQSLEKNNLGSHYAGLNAQGVPANPHRINPESSPASSTAVAILKAEPKAPATAPMTPMDAPELWRFHRDQDYRNALINEVLMGFPSQEQLEGLKAIHKVQMQEMQVLMDSLLADLDRIEEERDRAREELAERHEDRIEEIERQWSDHPEGVAEQINKEFGFEYVE